MGVMMVNMKMLVMLVCYALTASVVAGVLKGVGHVSVCELQLVMLLGGTNVLVIQLVMYMAMLRVVGW